MMQTLAKAYNDPYKKAKARAMYRSHRMGEQERFTLSRPKSGA